MSVLPLDDPAWARFVASQQSATPFHDPAWAALLAECYSLRGFAVVARAGEEIAGGVPLLAAPRLPGRPARFVSLPFTDLVKPLVAPDDGGSLAAELDRVRRERGIASIELRGPVAGATALAGGAVVHELELADDPADVLARFGKTRRQSVRAAPGSGFSVHRAESEHDLTSTYYALHLETRRRFGVPAQPRRFFRLFWRRVVEPGLGFVLLANRGRETVAGAVFMAGHGTVVYKFSASTGERHSLGPTEVLLWHAIRDSCEQGYRCFDFGRSDGSATGLRRFKSSWGAVETPLVYSAIGDTGSRELASTPGAAAAVLRHAPVWVTRVTGELLYRYAA